MVLSALRQKRLESKLYEMTSQELLNEAASTRRKLDVALVGTVCQLIAAIPSQGTSLVGTAYSGPRLLYYWRKYHIVKHVVASQSLKLNLRKWKDMLVPAVVGALTLGLGACADGIEHFHDTPQYNSSPENNPVLKSVEWLGEFFDAASASLSNHSEAIANPAFAAEIAHGDYSTGYGGDLVQHFQHGFDRLKEGWDMSMPGGAPLLTEKSAEVLGAGVMATFIGEIAGKLTEGCLPKASGQSRKKRS